MVDRVNVLYNRVNKIYEELSKHSSPEAKTLIISTGDISDIDGFYALAKYAQSGADVLFIMNYPAYLDSRMVGKIKNDQYLTDDQKNGLGFDFTTRTYIDTFDSVMTEQSRSDSDVYKKYLKLKAKYQPESNDRLPESWMKQMFTDLAFTMASGVWNETKIPDGIIKGDLHFYVGGINTISPFSANVTKNEIFVYADSLLQSGIRLPSSGEGVTYNQKQKIVDVHMLLASSKEIYMDFNGSMAFYDDEWSMTLRNLKQKIKAVFVMGGVLSTTATKTKPKINNVLNRFSCATMNQLYSPDKTAKFFEDMKTMQIQLFVIANNVVHDLKVEFGDLGWRTFIVSNSIQSECLDSLANTYYTSQVNAQQKAFDFYTALALTDKMKGINVKGDTNLLYFDSKYGLCVIGHDGKPWEEIISKYYSHLDLKYNDKDNPSVKTMKVNLIAEKSVLENYNMTSSMTVQVLSFGLAGSVLVIQ